MRVTQWWGFLMSRRFILFALLGLVALGALLPSCDKLVTEVNNITVYDTTIGKECQKCHTDKDDKLIVIPKAQWANSKHASPDLLERPVMLNGKLQTATACGAACHSGNGYVDSILTGFPGSIDTLKPSVINCFTCHLPHSIPNDPSSVDSLRGISAAVTLANDAKFIAGKSNMCANCHRAIGAPPTGTSNVILTSSSVPHFGAQADVNSGLAGVRFESGAIASSHTAAGSSFNGCINCHFGQGQGYDFGEHTFRLQYHDAVHDTTPYVVNCTMGGCHALRSVSDLWEVGVDKAPQALQIRDSIVWLSDTLHKLLLYANVLDPADSTGRTILTPDTVSALLAKIAYNYLLYTNDGSRGLHHPQLITELLTTSFKRWDSIPPKAMFTASPTDGCAPLTVQFTGQSKFSVDSALWSFGDNLTDTALNPTHTYDSGGNYTVKLKVFGQGGIDSLVRSNYIQARAQVRARIGYAGSPTLPDSIKGCLNTNIVFVDSSTGGVTARTWTFLDSNLTAVTATVSRKWTVAGTYEVPIKLVVSNDCTPLGDSLLDTVLVVADSTPVAAFTVSTPNDTVFVNDTIFFTDQSRNARQWHWLFGFSNVTSDLQSPFFVPTTAGAYIVKLTVTNFCGTNFVEHTVTAINHPAPPTQPPGKSSEH